MHAGQTCEPTTSATTDATHALSRLSAEPGAGSPGIDEIVATVSLERGEALWRIGRPFEAYAALAAGIPETMASERPTPDTARLRAAPPLRGQLPAWRQEPALGDVRRNAFLLSELMRASGQPAVRGYWLDLAADAGLPEAVAARER